MKTRLFVMLAAGLLSVGAFQDYTYDHTYTPSAIERTKADSDRSVNRIYTLDGRQASTLQKGVNITHMNDGTAKKVIVR